MTEPLSFPSLTPRHSLPLVFAGQAQKEPAVNAAHALTDILLHPAVEGTAATAPENASEGDCWLVGADATGPFAGRDHAIAGFVAGVWQFAEAGPGMQVFDKSSGHFRIFRTGWEQAADVAVPTGGGVIDAEARVAISQLILAFRAAGILPPE